MDARVKDIDLVVAGNFADNRTVQFPGRGGSQKTFKVKNFVILVEVKGHDPRHVKFSGGNAFVKYSDSQDWGSATDQSRGQLHSFIRTPEIQADRQFIRKQLDIFYAA